MNYGDTVRGGWRWPSRGAEARAGSHSGRGTRDKEEMRAEEKMEEKRKSYLTELRSCMCIFFDGFDEVGIPS